MIKRKLTMAILAVAVVCGLAHEASAVVGRTWEMDKKELLSGEMDNLSVTSRGWITLNFKLDKIETEDELTLWSSASDGKGTTYFGTGLNAAIYKLVGDKIEKIDLGAAAAADMIVSAMKCDGKGDLYAAVLPTGRIIKIDSAGKASVFATLPEFYIWQIVFDKTGRIYVATGPAGRVYRLSADGKTSEIVYDSDEDNIVSMEFNDRGDLYFGTSPGAILMKIEAAELAKPKPAVKVVYDFPMSDVRTMQFHNGLLYIGVNKSGDDDEDLYDIIGKSYDYNNDDANNDEMQYQKHSIRVPYGRSEQGVVFSIDERGDVERITGSRRPVVRVRVVGDTVYIAVIGENKVYAYNTETRETSFFKIDEDHAYTFEIVNGKLGIIGTSNPGAVYRVSEMAPAEGVYTSRVMDAGTTAGWGTLRWEGRGGLQFQTRSGDTENPDSTWSEWTAMKAASAPDAPEKIASPSARFIQFRAVWQSADTTLEKISLSYLARNIRPAIAKIMVGKGGNDDEEDNERMRYSRSRMMIDDEEMRGLPIMWMAVDPNGDKLEFDLYYKEEGERSWKKLNFAGPLTKPMFGLDTDLLPSGRYRVKVVASDAPSNPNSGALTREMISDVFVVDHDGPVLGALIAVRKGADTIISCTAVDAIHNVARAEYAIDGRKWQAGNCTDGIFDGKSETVRITLAGLEAGDHTIVVRVYDTAGNVSVRSLIFTVAKQAGPAAK